MDHAAENAIHWEWMLKHYNAVWILSHLWYRLSRPILLGDRLELLTWHRVIKGPRFYRDFDLLIDGENVGEAVSTWILLEVDKRQPLRLSGIPGAVSSTPGDQVKSRMLGKLQMPAELTFVGQRPMQYSDADVHGHVNNTRYADFACDVMGLENRERQFISEMQICYVAECKVGERIDIHAGWQEENYYVHGVDPAGKSRFRIAVTLGTVQG